MIEGFKMELKKKGNEIKDNSILLVKINLITLYPLDLLYINYTQSKWGMMLIYSLPQSFALI